MATLAFQNLKETMHARLTTGAKPPASLARAMSFGTSNANSQNSSSEGNANPASWKGFTLFGEATTSIGQAVKSLVSTVAQTWALDDFPSDIDGVYLTNRLLVIGPPRKKLADRDRFRNDADRVRELIISRHGTFNNTLVFDLAPGQSLVDTDGLKRAVVQFDLDRPTLEVLREACAAIVSWLDVNSQNVAIITCTNGIKSTCLVAACVYSELHDLSIRQGLCKFFEERMKLKKSYPELLQKLPPSYDRLLKAYERESFNENMDIPLQLATINFRRIPFRQGDSNDRIDPKVLIRSGTGYRRVEKVIQLASDETVEFDCDAGMWKIQFEEPLTLSGDATLDVSIGNSSSDIILFSFPFPVGAFDAGTVRYGPDAMDEVRRHVLPADFVLELCFKDVEKLVEDASFAKAKLCGKELCSLRHIVKPTRSLVSYLISNYEAEERDAVFALQRTNNDLAKAVALLTSKNEPVLNEFDDALSQQENSYTFATTPGNVSRQNMRTPKAGVLAQVDGNSAQAMMQRAGAGGGPMRKTPVNNITGTGNSMTTPAKRRLEQMDEDDDPTLSPFLRETIGKGLSSPITPMRTPGDGRGTRDALKTGGKSDEDAVGEMDKLLLAQLAQLLNSDASLAGKVEKLAEGKATIVELENGVPLVGSVPQQPTLGLASDVAAASKPVTEAAVAVKPTETESNPGNEPTLGQHESYGTFFRMMKMGVPRDAVEQKMKRDGFSTKALDLGANAPVSKLVEMESKTVGQEEPYQKYFKMLKMGVPHPAVQQRMVKDGVNSLVLDLGENAPVSKLEELLAAKSKSAGGSSGPGTDAKKKVTRQKTIRWDAIPEERLQKGMTIWHQADSTEEEDLLQFNSNDLENLFIRKPEDANAAAGKKTSVGADASTGNGENKAKEAAKRKKSVLDARRAQSICIGMAKMKMSGSEYAKALVDLNEEVLSSRVLQIIQGCNLFPSSEEATMLLRHSASPSQLAEPDEFLYEVARSCPDCTGRIEALTFRYLFEEIAQSTLNDAKKLEEACNQVKSSSKLKDLLRVVLLIGNQINSKGEGDDNKIRAFTLASLLKLSQTKSLNKTTTVLEYLVNFLMTKMPQVLEVAEELNLVNLVKRIDIVAIQRQSKDLKKGLDGVAQSFKGLEQFCLSAYATMKEVEQSLTAAKQSFSNVLDYFGEDQAMSSCDFFTTLSSFLASFAHTKKELIERDKRNARKKQQQQQALLQQQKKQQQLAQKKENAASQAAPLPTEMMLKKTEATEVASAVRGSDIQTEQYPHLADFLRNL